MKQSTKKKRDRLDRQRDFEDFKKRSEVVFKKFQKNDKSSDVYQGHYGLCVCPGGRAGGNDKRLVEVFWGHRIFDTQETFDFQAIGHKWEAKVEHGATIQFHLNDKGFVSIFLFPAYTENLKPIEDFIILYAWIDPIKLLDEVFLSSIWRAFMAYMEVTSLDGIPTTEQKRGIRRLRLTKRMVINNKCTPAAISEKCKRFALWLINIAASVFA